jgi:hypothetical protein
MRPRKIPIGIPQQAALLTEDKAEEKWAKGAFAPFTFIAIYTIINHYGR